MKVTNDFLTGFEVLFYWFDQEENFFIFNEDKTGLKEDSENNFVEFRWKINEKGILAIIYDNNDTCTYWKFESESEEDSFNVQEFIKSKSDNKPLKSKILLMKRKSKQNMEEQIQKENIEKIKTIFKDYNKWNYTVILNLFFVYFIILYIAINNVVIIENFPFYFQFVVMFAATAFFFRQLFFIFNKLSYKVRYWIELDKDKKDK